MCMCTNAMFGREGLEYYSNLPIFQRDKDDLEYPAIR